MTPATKEIPGNFPGDDTWATVGTTAEPRGWVFVSVNEDDHTIHAVAHFTPKRARKLALAIISAADAAERESAK